MPYITVCFYLGILLVLVSIAIVVYFPQTVDSTSKLKGDLIHSATLSGLSQHNYPDNGSNLFLQVSLVFPLMVLYMT
jgi:hypothetical protein